MPVSHTQPRELVPVPPSMSDPVDVWERNSDFVGRSLPFALDFTVGGLPVQILDATRGARMGIGGGRRSGLAGRFGILPEQVRATCLEVVEGASQ